jgi:hypothetical protein
MKKSFPYLLFIAMLFNTGLFAASVSVQTAQSVALNFYTVTAPNYNPHLSVSAVLSYTQTEPDSTITFYAFNIQPANSFVMVAADDNVTPVIAYSFESYFSDGPGIKKTGVGNWIYETSGTIHGIIQQQLQADARINSLWAAYQNGTKPVGLKSAGVSPLLSTTWDQEPYYNADCPYNSTDQMYCVTGCVATAMAQIMKFWAYPTVGIGGTAPAYTSASYGYSVSSAPIGGTTFHWSSMPNSVTSSNTYVAQLMFYCGVAVQMDYGDDNQGGSGAYVQYGDCGGGCICAESAYTTYFNYNSNTIQGVYQANYTSNGWINLIEGELNAGRPVQYEGTDPNNGGHTWVCDGYDVNNNFHMNWGWSGMYDGVYYSASNLNPGGYTFSQNDGALIGIEPIVTFTVSASTLATSICSGASTTISASGGSGTTFSWSPTTGLNCATCGSTSAHPTSTTTYTVTADSGGMQATSTVTINVDPAVTVGNSSATNVLCHGLSDGTASVSGSGGTPSYTYHWSTGASSSSVSNLAVGTYTVTITDAAGCTTSASKTITQPNTLAVTTTAANATCGRANGGVTSNVTGGTSSYTYHWNTGSSASSLSNISAGTYNVTVTDRNNCTTTASAVVSSTGSFTASTSATDILCYGNSTGSASVTTSGAISPITYSWSNGGNTANISNVAAGTYTVTVVDHSGCSVTASETVTQPAALNITLTPVNASCGSLNGSISASISGGTSGYTYSWSDGSNTPSIHNLSPGTYKITVTDSHNCSATAAVIVGNSTTLNATATTTEIVCNGEANGSISVNATGIAPITYHWSNGGNTASVSNLSAGNYNVTVTDAGGCSTTLSETITQPAVLHLSLTSVDAGCDQSTGSATANASGGNSGYNYVWSNGGNTATINSIDAGTYHITVTDVHGCSTTGSVLVGTTGSLTVSVATTNVSCNGGANGIATVTPGSGIGPYAYQWSTGATTHAISNLVAGSYKVTVTDSHSCSAVDDVVVTQPNVMQATAAGNNATNGQNNGAATVTTVVNAAAPCTYAWNNGGNSQTITGLAAGTYDVTVTDRNGCTATASATVEMVTAINQVSGAISFNIFPNPTSGLVSIQLSQLNGETTLTLENVLGQTLVTQTITNIQTKLDLSAFADGVYIISLRQGDKMAVKQIVVNK